MDPVGIFMLKSIVDIFDSLGENIESLKLEGKSMNYPNAVTRALDDGIVPVVLAVHCGQSKNVHAMVSIGHAKTYYHEKFLKCKNSYRDDPDEPGIFQQKQKCRIKLQNS